MDGPLVQLFVLGAIEVTSKRQNLAVAGVKVKVCHASTPVPVPEKTVVHGPLNDVAVRTRKLPTGPEQQ